MYSSARSLIQLSSETQFWIVPRTLTTQEVGHGAERVPWQQYGQTTHQGIIRILNLCSRVPSGLKKVVAIFFRAFILVYRYTHTKLILCQQYIYTTQNLLRITFTTVCYFCVFVINMEIDLKELNIISASCTWQIDNLSTQ